jgi:hypothetical protein
MFGVITMKSGVLGITRDFLFSQEAMGYRFVDYAFTSAFLRRLTLKCQA